MSQQDPTLISHFRETSWIGYGEFHEGYPIVALVTPKATLRNMLYFANGVISWYQILFQY